jgi:NAD(P)H-hydrate repair Nnr-like enzyme with NAD(P)H-hydrate epimerase domain
MDYASLAAKYGGTPAPAGGAVNYAALAQKYGGTTAATIPNNGAAQLAPPATPTPDSVINNANTKQYGFAPKAAQFLGISKLGQGLATAGLTVTGQGNQGGDAEAAAAHQLSAIMAKYPVGSPERKTAIQNYQNLYKGGVPTQAQIDPGTQLSTKEVLGSAGNLALDAMSGGTLSGAGTTAPALVSATNVIDKAVAPIEATGVAGRIGNAAIKGAEFGAAQGVTQGANQNLNAGDIAKQAGTTSLLTGVLSGGIQGATELAKYLTSPAVSESLYNRAIGIDKKTALAGRSPAAGMIEQGKVGTATGLLNDAQKTIDATNSQIQDVLASDTTKHNTGDLIEQMRAQISNQYKDTLGPEGVQSLMDSLPIAKMKNNPELTTAELNGLRQQIDSNFIGNGKWLSNPLNSDPVKVSSYKTAADVLRQTVQGQDARLPGLYDTLSQSITARNALDSELAKPHALTHMLELLTGVGAGGEALLHGDPRAAAGALGAMGVFHAANSTLGQTAAAVTLDKANQALANPGLIAKASQAVGTILGRRAIANTTSPKAR